MIDLQHREFHSENAYSDFSCKISGYRFYSPEIGRWMSRDPIEEYVGINLYVSMLNDAVDLVDLFGLWCVQVTVTSITGSKLDCFRSGGPWVYCNLICNLAQGLGNKKLKEQIGKDNSFGDCGDVAPCYERYTVTSGNWSLSLGPGSVDFNKFGCKCTCKHDKITATGTIEWQRDRKKECCP